MYRNSKFGNPKMVRSCVYTKLSGLFSPSYVPPPTPRARCMPKDHILRAAKVCQRLQYSLSRHRLTLIACIGRLVPLGWITAKVPYGPRREKTCLRGFRQSEILTSLLSYRYYLENLNFIRSRFTYETFQKANNKGADRYLLLYRMIVSIPGPRSAVGNVSGYRCVSDCRSRGREFDPGPVPYFRGDWSWNNFYGHSPPFRWFIQEGLLSVTSESMCTNYWLTACSSLPRKKCG